MTDYSKHGTHQEQRTAPRQRVPGTPEITVTYSAAAGQLVIQAHVDVPDGFVVPAGFKARVAAAMAALVAAQEGQS